MVTAEDALLIVLNLTTTLPDDARKALLTIAVRTPDRFRSLESGAARLIDGSVALSADGLFVDTTKVADLRDVVELIPRDAVREVSVESNHGSLVWAAVGGGAGFVAGLVTGLALAEHESSHVGSTAAFGLFTDLSTTI